MKYLNADCLDHMKEFDDNYFDIAVVDPPYGIGEHGGKVRDNKGVKSWHEKLEWDKEIPSQEYFDQLFRVSKHQIIFGINYYTNCRYIPIGSGPASTTKGISGKRFGNRRKTEYIRIQILPSG